MGKLAVGKEVHLSGTTAEERRMAIATVDVVIPAFNEERCIEDVLCDVTAAREDDWFEIQSIYVISDASTDQTDDVVQRVARKDRRVKLLQKKERKGKQETCRSINRATIKLDFI